MSYKTTVTIAAGQSLSDALNLSRFVSDEGVVLKDPDFIGLYIPSAWETADITLQSSEDGITYYNVQDAAKNEYVIEAEAGALITLDPNAFRALKYVKFRSGKKASAIAQTYEITLELKFNALQE